jgi:hypothetical protein
MTERQSGRGKCMPNSVERSRAEFGDELTDRVIKFYGPIVGLHVLRSLLGANWGAIPTAQEAAGFLRSHRDEILAAAAAEREQLFDAATVALESPDETPIKPDAVAN